MQIKSNYKREVILSIEEREAMEDFRFILMALINIMKATGEDLKVESWDGWKIYSLEGLEKFYAEIESFNSLALIKKEGEDE